MGDMRTLLVVDDNEDLREILQFEFERAGYRVLAAVSGTDAFDLLGRETVSAVISDIRMPRGDGVSLLKNIRSTPAIAGLPVYLITGYADIAAADLARLNCDGIFHKPFDLTRIKDVLTARLADTAAA